MSASQFIRARIAVHRNSAIGVLLLAALVLVGLATIEGFSSPTNLKSMLLLAAFLGLASLGQTLCVLIGGIDLSIAFVIGAANILLASLIALGVPPLLGCFVILAGGTAFGILNGLLTFWVQRLALIVTLGTGFAVVGCAQIVASIGSSYAGNVFGRTPGWLVNLSSMGGQTFGLPLPPVILLWLGISVIAILVLARTWFGRALYAVGGNRTAAARLGISEFGIWLAAYAASGAMAALTGIVLLGFSGGGFAGVGDPYLLTTITAVVIGGSSLLGGRGGYGATVVGVLVLILLSSILVGWGLGYPAQQAILGMLVVPLAAVYSRAPHIRDQI